MEFLKKLQFFLRRQRFDEDLEEEMRHHLAMKASEQGSPEAARRAFGNITRVKEDSRAMWTWTLAEQLAQDLRYGLRMMASHPLFTAMAALSLALGIGANTAIYSFMDAILMRSLPVRDPQSLVTLNWRAKDRPAVAHRGSLGWYSPPRVDWSGRGSHMPYMSFSARMAISSRTSPLTMAHRFLSA
jgi:macrolide transport system ATP-binding/permease protein